MKNIFGKSIGVIVVIILFYATYPFIFLTKEVRKFCEELETSKQEISFETIIDNAENEGFRVYENQTKKTLLISDTRTIGKFTCAITVKNNKLKYTYLDN